MILLLLELYDFVLGLDDVLQRLGVIVVEVDAVSYTHLTLPTKA